MKPFEIFKPGTHTSAEGETLSFADADLGAIAASYDPAVHHAPIVVGHPKQDAPAYGWVDKVEVTDGRLVAVPADIDPAFSDLVRQGKYRKVSAAFYRPDSANNPKPGAWYLRHVGFLGAAAPAVKGLKPVAFSDDGGTVFAEFDLAFADVAPWIIESIGRMFRGVRDYLVANTSVEEADRIIPAWDVEQLTTAGATMRMQNDGPTGLSYSETEETTMTKEELAAAEARLAEIAAREKALDDRQAAFAEAERKARTDADTSYVASVVKEGRLPVGLQAQATALFAELDDDAVSFADGGEQKSMSPRAMFRDLLGKLPVPVATGELATDDAVDFSDAEGVAAAIKTEIDNAAAKGQMISPVEASARLKRASK